MTFFDFQFQVGRAIYSSGRSDAWSNAWAILREEYDKDPNNFRESKRCKEHHSNDPIKPYDFGYHTFEVRETVVLSFLDRIALAQVSEASKTRIRNVVAENQQAGKPMWCAVQLWEI